MMKTGRIVICFCLLLVSQLILLPSGAVLAQDEEEKIELEPTYRKLEATAPGASFEFEVALSYQGSEARDFDLSVSAPTNWSVFVKPNYGEQMIGSIRLESGGLSPTKVKVAAIPPFFIIPEPGEYEVTLEVSSGNIRGTVDLTAVITAAYALNVVPTTERYNTKVSAGKDNYITIEIENMGSGTLENIKFSSRKPSGWTIEFAPLEIENLSPGSVQTIDVNIKPDPKAIAGDYEITLTTDAKQTVEDIKIRVTVETPTVWGWVGIGIILVVIAGVTVIFMRFSRR